MRHDGLADSEVVHPAVVRQPFELREWRATHRAVLAEAFDELRGRHAKPSADTGGSCSPLPIPHLRQQRRAFLNPGARLRQRKYRARWSRTERDRAKPSTLLAVTHPP